MPCLPVPLPLPPHCPLAKKVWLRPCPSRPVTFDEEVYVSVSVSARAYSSSDAIGGATTKHVHVMAEVKCIERWDWITGNVLHWRISCGSSFQSRGPDTEKRRSPKVVSGCLNRSEKLRRRRCRCPTLPNPQWHWNGSKSTPRQCITELGMGPFKTESNQSTSNLWIQSSPIQ